ncbi:MAG: electron transfer flavoprotein subunit alpha/FixB family protein, partial [Vicingaceae bacterium]
MSILVYANTAKNKVHNSAFEAVSYGARIAETAGDTVTAVVVGNADNLDSLGKYGADKVIHITNDKLVDFQPTLIAEAIQKSVDENNASIVIFSHDLSGKSIAPILAAKMSAGIVTGAIDLPKTDGDFIVKKAVFS